MADNTDSNQPGYVKSSSSSQPQDPLPPRAPSHHFPASYFRGVFPEELVLPDEDANNMPVRNDADGTELAVEDDMDDDFDEEEEEEEYDTETTNTEAMQESVGSNSDQPSPDQDRSGVPWTPEEDAQLMSLRKNGLAYTEISKDVTGRTYPACSQRYARLLRMGRVGSSMLPPADRLEKETKRWTPQEEAVLRAWKAEGLRWKDIAKKLPGRTARACYEHYYIRPTSVVSEDQGESSHAEAGEV